MNNVVGFSARIINPQDKPKYLNSSEHKAFEKSKLLYGLNIVKQNIKQYNHIIIVEGQMDVIALHRLDMPIGVATCGTALTAEHLKLIKRYTENVYLLFDNDAAGQEATIRALNIAYQNNIFPKKIRLPLEYKDTDDLANISEGKEIINTSFKQAQDGFVATFHELKATNDLSSPIEKQKILNILFGLIQSMNNISMQQHYVQVMSDLIGSPFEITYEQYKKFSRDEGRFTQPRKKTETAYQIDRSLLSAALFYENFIDQFIENQQMRNPLKQLVEKISLLLPESAFGKIKNIDDETGKIAIAEMQLRWEKELNDADEKKRYHTIKQTIENILHTYIQQLFKSKTISDNDKKELLKLKQAVE
jgi:DNA primase